jgi:5-methylcytosine-specific restriction endonuclease McrA
VRVQTNSKAKRDKDREWRNSPAGREARRLTEQRRRARKAAVASGISAGDWQEILDRFNNRCAYCLDQTDLEIEHMRPLSLGGAHDKDNVVPACAPCNRRKNRRDLLQSLAVVGVMAA